MASCQASKRRKRGARRGRPLTPGACRRGAPATIQFVGVALAPRSPAGQAAGKVPIRTVIIDDEVVFRQMLASALSRVRGLVVAGAFKDGKSGLEHCLKDPPGLVVVDLYLPGMHGLEVVREIRAKLPNTRILVLTGHPDGDLPARLIAQGVHGFVDKNAPINYVLQAVESVMTGGMFFASHIQPKTTPEGAKAASAGPKVAPDVKLGP